MQFSDASSELKNDREIVLAAVKQKGTTLLISSGSHEVPLQYAADELRNDREIVIE